MRDRLDMEAGEAEEQVLRRRQNRREAWVFAKLGGLLVAGIGSLLVCAGYPDERPNVFRSELGSKNSEYQKLSEKDRIKWINKIKHHLQNAADFKAIARKEGVNVDDRAELWANGVLDAMEDNKIPVTNERVELALILLHRESRLQVDPEANIRSAYARYRRALDDKVDEIAPATGATRDFIEQQIATFESEYGDRIKNAKTERELDDVLAELRGKIQPTLTTAYPYIPSDTVRGLWDQMDRKLRVRTFGALQVGTDMGSHYYRSRGEPNITPEEVKDRLFTLRGNLDVGFALFFTGYDAYEGLPDRLKYAFADYNSGLYSSRNAGFQAMISELSGVDLALDGDCLRYNGEWVVKDKSQTEMAISKIGNFGWFWEGEYTMNVPPIAGMQVTEHFIRSGLEKEKTAGFSHEPVYLRVSELYEQRAGKEPIKAMIPTVEDPGAQLKYGRGFSTQWYVDDSMRYVREFKW